MTVNELIIILNELIEHGKGDYVIEVEMHDLYGVEVDDRRRTVDLEN